MRPPALALALLLFGFAALLHVEPAWALEPGTSLLSLEVAQGTADLVSPDGPYLSAYDHPELGVQLGYWRLVNDALAVNLGVGFGAIRERNQADGHEDRYYQQRSWNVRLGADRTLELGHNTVFFFGPGVEYWSGYARFIDLLGSGTVTAPTVTRLSVSGRFGGMMVVSDSFSIIGHMGYRFGYAGASNATAKTQWYTGGVEAGAGLAYAF